jgi:DNA-binding MarR family transcriptional regulator
VNEVGVDSATRAWQAMTALVTERNDRRREASETLGMSFVRLKVLRRVAASTELTMRQLSELTGIDRPYTTVIIDDLEGRGLVSRTTSAHDRRCKIVTATTSGRAAAAEAEHILGSPPPALRALPADQLDLLADILDGLLEPTDAALSSS